MVKKDNIFGRKNIFIHKFVVNCSFLCYHDIEFDKMRVEWFSFP